VILTWHPLSIGASQIYASGSANRGYCIDTTSTRGRTSAGRVAYFGLYACPNKNSWMCWYLRLVPFTSAMANFHRPSALQAFRLSPSGLTPLTLHGLKMRDMPFPNIQL
jgi:hypothetical protein